MAFKRKEYMTTDEYHRRRKKFLKEKPLKDARRAIQKEEYEANFNDELKRLRVDLAKRRRLTGKDGRGRS